VRRVRMAQTIGSDEVLMDMLVIRITRNADYR